MTTATATYTEPVVPDVLPEPIEDLNIADRCDATAGEIAVDGTPTAEQAYVRIVTAHGYLDFCGHHFAENEAAIVAAGYRVLDRRDRLGAKATGDEVR